MSDSASTRPVFAILSALIEDRAGLHYGPADQEVFLSKTSGRAADAGFDSLLDYYYYLRYDPAGEAEIDALVDALVVNETFFFRELAPLRVLCDQFVAPAVRAGRRPRIWCAACATGEEPLTLAMLLAKANLLNSVELIASDISQRVLDRARAGRFGKRALREVPEPALVERFLRVDAQGVTIDSELTKAIDWRRINLCDPGALASVGVCDIILCRNVMIYFSDQTTVQTIRGLTDALRPNGVLLVGVSESLLRFGATLVCEELNQVFLYRKPA